MILGMPKRLVWGYIALAVFMAGDGFDLTFLSRYLVTQHGFTSTQAGLCFTVYGLVVAFSAWTTGVLAETFGAKRLMLLGGILWIGLHVLFLTVGLISPVAAILTYGARGIAYPLFMYSFVVLIAQSVDPGRLASAMGWFWAAFSVGLGSLGAFIPTLTIPHLGETGTLWLAPVLVGVGTLMCLFLVPKAPPEERTAERLEGADRARELLRGVTILVENRQILLSVIIRILCNLALYGFPMMMPLYLTGQLDDSQPWFQQTEWMTLWAVMNTITIVANIVWGRLGDRYGWMRQMRWFGFGGMALSAFAFGYFPHLFGANYAMMLIAAVIFACSVTAFVPMGAIFPALAPQHRGAAISAHNLASGLTTFIGPGIATALLPLIGSLGVIWVYILLFLSGIVITFFIRPPQPGITDENGRMLPAGQRRRARAGTSLAH